MLLVNGSALGKLTSCKSLPLKLVQSSIYATSLADDKYLRNTKMYLAVRSEMSEAELISKTPYLVKVCSANHIEHLVRQALPGVALAHTPRPPSAIPVKLNYQYFSLSQTGVAWESDCTRSRNLGGVCAGRFPESAVETDYFAAGSLADTDGFVQPSNNNPTLTHGANVFSRVPVSVTSRRPTPSSSVNPRNVTTVNIDSASPRQAGQCAAMPDGRDPQRGCSSS